MPFKAKNYPLHFLKEVKMRKVICLNLFLLFTIAILTLGSTGNVAVSEQTVQLVKELGYSDTVAQDFVNMVISWKDAQGRALLDSSNERLGQVKEAHRQGKISKKELADIELNVIRNLVRRIKQEFSYERGASDLSILTKRYRANCLGFTQLFFILGNAIGVSVEAVDVRDMGERPLFEAISWKNGVPKRTPSVTSMRPSTFSGHVVDLVNLADGSKVLVDLASNREIRGPFEFEKVYKKTGIIWETSEPGKDSLFYPRIRKVSKKNLIGNIKMSKADTHWESEDYTKIIPILDEAMSLDTEGAHIYFNRAQAYFKLGKFTEAEADYRRALDLDPKFPLAYQGLGRLYMMDGKYNEAVAAFRKALDCDFNLGEAHLNIAEILFAARHYEAASMSYLMSKIKFGERKYWTDQEPVSESVLAYIDYQRGMSWYNLKVYYLSKICFVGALELDPTFGSKIEEMLKLIKTRRAQNIKQLSPSDIPELITQARSNDFPADQHAMESLVTIGQPAVPALIRILKDEDETLGFRYCVTDVLAAIGRANDDVVSALIQDLKDPSGYLAIEEVLIRIGESAIPALKKAAIDQDEDLRKKIGQILKRIENR